MVTKDCCPVLALVLSRANPSDRTGIAREPTFSFTGKTREVLLCRFRKAPRGDKSEFASATFAEFTFCPFCGVRVTPLTVEPVKPATKRGRRK